MGHSYFADDQAAKTGLSEKLIAAIVAIPAILALAQGVSVVEMPSTGGSPAAIPAIPRFWLR